MLQVILGLISLVLILWLFGFVYANDFSVQTKDFPKKVRRVLFVFPHADDEGTSGGLISQLSKVGKEVTWVILTKGERGNEGANFDEDLKAVRIKEAQNAANVYKVKNVIQEDFPDNEVAEHRQKLKKELEKIVSEESPDLVITYDLAGLYGHPDHIVVSEVLTELLKENDPNIKLWYVSFPKRILDTVALPEQMAKDAAFKERRLYPTHKVWVGIYGVLNKIKVSYVYKSQGGSSSRNMPIKFIPFWFYISLTLFEYYHEVR